MIIAIVGLAGSGKTDATARFIERGFLRVGFNDRVYEELALRGLERNESNERTIREEMRAKEGMGVMALRSINAIRKGVVRGRVVRKTNFGAFVEVAPGVEALCHNSEMPEDGEPLEVEQEHDFKIVKIQPKERRIGLSLKALAPELERRAVEQYRAGQPRSAATLGEIVNAKNQRAGAEKS